MPTMIIQGAAYSCHTTYCGFGANCITQYTYSDTIQITYLLMMCNNMHMVAETRRIRRNLLGDDWYLSRHRANQDIYRHPTIDGIITLPRHRYVSKGADASIARKAK